ncbi:MAG: hypothetical protein QOF04_1856, partial [Solirubrobacteraceae bacterium]|nr:hypothetical protein [Solirubrobacteraceae bacterium]
SPLPDLDEALGAEAVVEAGDRTLSITASRLGDQEGDGIVWTLRDISERARLDRIKSDFVATASHELRSPLTSIKGFVELLGRSQALGDREREFVDVILQSTDRLVDLVNDLLDASRLEAGKMEVHPRLFDVSEVVREVAALMVARVAEKDQRLDLDLPPGLPRVLADPARVRQIMINLVSNAHLYTGEGGRITITVDRVQDGVELAVADSGRGMSQAEIDEAFDRFSRREDGGSGTGLGLSIVKSLVDLQGGSIDVTSRPGEGTVFTVRLPAEPEGAHGEAPRSAIRGKRVLVVDDELAIAELIAAKLEPFEVETELVTSGQEAIERLREGSFDALTLDLLMDGVSGLEVLRELRADEELRRTPVVVVSILSEHEALFGEWKVTKPIDSEELADALGSAVLAGRVRVLAVGRPDVRTHLRQALDDLAIEHEWASTPLEAARLCAMRRFEVALVDAGLPDVEAAIAGLDLRGRRLRRSIVVVSADGDSAPGFARLDAEPISVGEAGAAVLALLEPAAAADL